MSASNPVGLGNTRISTNYAQKYPGVIALRDVKNWIVAQE